ncbi:MAG: ATP-dependent helicase, partial [Candidatus Woesearchaeota archaeon]
MQKIIYKTEKEKPEQILKILNPIVKEWFFSKFKEFSIPQLYGVFPIHCRENILISAPTGATKTLTGFLSILNELVDLSQKKILEDKIYAVYISPLKSLNYDISVNLINPLKEMEKIAGKKLGIRVAVRTGDTSSSEKAKMLKNSPHILITTPESLAILLTSPKFREHFRAVEWCIIDEVHALAENKRGVHLSLTLERMQRICNFTRIGLSATISPLEEVAKYLVGNDRDCKIADINFIKEMDLKVISPVRNLVDTTYEYLHNKLYELLDSLIQQHRTTLIFTNTRSATERVVHHLKEKFPKNYTENIGAHHGSLSKTHRHNIEQRLREGKLKCVVCSTSLELGIDIGYIDLVILLGSPKSVARAIQRVGRSGHQLHSKTKGRIIVLDRDDLVECAVLLKNAIEKKIDKIHIPQNCLDVLAQQIAGMATEQVWHIDDLYNTIKRSYCYKNLGRKEFGEVIDYLAGKYVSLEDRHVYAKIWFDENSGMVGRRGKLSRVIYLTNIGTIPEEAAVKVKMGEQVIGTIEEAFLERLKKGDIFVLGGDTYKFNFSRGMTAQVEAAIGKKPTVPSWFSEMLPLSFELANEIGKFRRLIEEKFKDNEIKSDIINFIDNYLYVDENAANSIYEYFREQFLFEEIPTDKKLIIETYYDGQKHYAIFHSLFGRRVNDALSRAVALAIGRKQHVDVEIGINDNGFYVASSKGFDAEKALSALKSAELRAVVEQAIDRTEILTRRFRHCAARALMILKNYKGEAKKVGRQQVSSMILLNAVKRISNDFPILKEAKREVLEDLMDIKNAEGVI